MSNLPRESRQGYLGDVESKSLPELKDLLARQEKLLSRKQFLERMKDGGKKSKEFAEYLKELIDKKSKLEASSRLRDVKVFSTKVQEVSSSKGRNEILNAEAEGRQGNSDKQDHLPRMNEEDLISKLEGVKLSERVAMTLNSPVENSYGKIMKRTGNQGKKEKFLPHKTLLHHERSDAMKDAVPKQLKYNEESSAKPPDYKFKEVKIISIDESVLLIEEQRIRSEELMAEQAAKRLAEKLVPKMKTYAPDTADLRYREQAKDSDDEDDVENVQDSDDAIDSDDDPDES